MLFSSLCRCCLRSLLSFLLPSFCCRLSSRLPALWWAVFTCNRSFYPTISPSMPSAHPVSALILLHPINIIEIPIMWSQALCETQKTTKNSIYLHLFFAWPSTLPLGYRWGRGTDDDDTGSIGMDTTFGDVVRRGQTTQQCS